MASIYQSIELLSKEKGIDPQIVLDAVKDAMLAAARKHFRSQEDLIADLDESTGNIRSTASSRSSKPSKTLTSRSALPPPNVSNRAPRLAPRCVSPNPPSLSAAFRRKRRNR